MNLITKLKKYIYDKIPRKDLHGFEYTVKELVGMWENSKWAVDNWHGQILSDEILRYKKSDTIFILGSGPSINDISEQQWNVIGKHDSIGFNWWLAHDFVPGFYMFQSAREGMLNILRDKHQQYEKVPFLIRGSLFASGRFDFTDPRLNLLKNNPVYFVNEYPISSTCAIDPVLLIRYVEALGYMTYGTVASFIPKWRGTLGLLISLSWQMGYKNIVLCGMDMHKSDHFWDYSPYTNLRSIYELPEPGRSNINTFTDSKWSPNTVPEYVYSLAEWMKKKRDVSIFLANQKTVLYPQVPLFSY